MEGLIRDRNQTEAASEIRYSRRKTVCDKSSRPMSEMTCFSRVHRMDTIIAHETMGEDL